MKFKSLFVSVILLLSVWVGYTTVNQALSYYDSKNVYFIDSKEIADCEILKINNGAVYCVSVTGEIKFVAEVK